MCCLKMLYNRKRLSITKWMGFIDYPSTYDTCSCESPVVRKCWGLLDVLIWMNQLLDHNRGPGDGGAVGGTRAAYFACTQVHLVNGIPNYRSE